MELRDQHPSLFGSSCTIERELSADKTSRVFVRKAAMTALLPPIATEVSTGRFTRETRLRAKLQHPHIVPILTAGNPRGILYYTVPLIARPSRLHLTDQ